MSAGLQKMAVLGSGKKPLAPLAKQEVEADSEEGEHAAEMLKRLDLLFLLHFVCVCAYCTTRESSTHFFPEHILATTN